jgi:hypothetical protein
MFMWREVLVIHDLEVYRTMSQMKVANMIGRNLTLMMVESLDIGLRFRKWLIKFQRWMLIMMVIMK